MTGGNRVDGVRLTVGDVGRRCRLRRGIIDKDTKIPPGTSIGFDLEADRRRGFTITENGVTVLAKAETLDASRG